MSFKVNCFNRVKKTLLLGLSRKESIKMQIIVVKLCAEHGVQCVFLFIITDRKIYVLYT